MISTELMTVLLTTLDIEFEPVGSGIPRTRHNWSDVSEDGSEACKTVDGTGEERGGRGIVNDHRGVSTRR